MSHAKNKGEKPRRKVFVRMYLVEALEGVCVCPSCGVPTKINQYEHKTLLAKLSRGEAQDVTCVCGQPAQLIAQTVDVVGQA
jgi:hypothetical protein